MYYMSDRNYVSFRISESSRELLWSQLNLRVVQVAFGFENKLEERYLVGSAAWFGSVFRDYS